MFKHWELLKNLAFVQLKLKYRGSLFGFLWSLANPLLLILVYMIAFKFILRIGEGERNYLFLLVSGILPWIFVSNTLVSSAPAVLGNGMLLKKVWFPRAVFPLSTVLFHLVQFLLAQVVFVPFFFYWSLEQGTLSPANLLYLPILFLLVLFIAGISLLLSSLTVFYRDVQHFTEVGVMVAFWLTPILYPFGFIPAEVRALFFLNPFTCFFHGIQSVLYESVVPGPEVFSLMLLWTAAALILGYGAFRRFEPRFAEEL